MKRGLLKLLAVGSSAAVVLVAAPPAAAAGNAGVHVHKTVDPLQLSVTPNIGLSLAVDQSTAIPGDSLTYTAVVSNPTATVAMGGNFDAEADPDTTAVVVYYWDQLEICGTGCGDGTAMNNPNWTAVATFEAGQPSYQPVQPPALHSGLTLAAQSVARSGVTYPTSGDPILGTAISPAATATWKYVSRVVLTPAQVAQLSDPTKAAGMRNVIHFEVTSRNSTAAQPFTDPEAFSNPLLGGPNPGAVANVTVTFTLPDGSTTSVGPTAAAALALLAPGGTATATAQYKVPVPAPRGATETEGGYATRLGALDGATLSASATAAGAGFSGPVYATSAAVNTTEGVPIVTIAKSGPAQVNAGDVETNPLTLQNLGSVGAVGISIIDTVPGGSGTVSGTPALLASGASGTATATYSVPANQNEGDLTDTASVTWKDANGNPYGSFTSPFTTRVHNTLFGAQLALTPLTAGPNPPGTSQTLTATLLDRNGNPITNLAVTFTITGANAGTGTATTDASGRAVFTYTGTNSGDDVARASVTAGGITISSNTATISWGALLQPVVTSQVQGNFFLDASDSCTFGAGPSSTPVFQQAFPDILFNADASFVPHDISAVNSGTRPFTDLTVDVNGNYNGQIVAQGNGQQAGTGSLSSFYAEFSGNFVVARAGDLTFTIAHDDGYILGVGNGATRVSGDFEGNPPANTPFNGYPTVAAVDQGGAGIGSATIHFPAPGTYPYELDYAECGGGGLRLILETAQFIAQTDPLSIYVGYADGLRAGGSIFPFPWQGSPNVTFIGGCTFDAGAIRFDNSGDTDITFDKVTVDLGSFVGAPHFDIWPSNLVVPAHGILILTQTGCFNFDTSDFSGAGCGGNNGVQPLVNVVRAGATTTYTDTHQVLNTHGFDMACQGNESISWQRIAGQASTINVPLPPAAMLDLTPFNVPGATQGQSLTLTVSALDGAGNPVASLPVSLQVFGANAQILNGTTGLNGLATFTYTGALAGSDTVQASAFVQGQREISNQGSVVWTASGGGGGGLGPSITNATPADGAVVTKPVAVDASIAAPSGHTITAWRVFYQTAGGPLVVIKSGTGAPPSPLGATFDPTLLVNGAYTITVEATADNGAVQDVSGGVTVRGGMKLGRYQTRFADLTVPVSGFQMQVVRTYDSADASSGDFGVGWRVDVSNFRVASNHTLGAGGWTMYDKSCALGLCFTAYKNSAPRFVTVTYPSGQQEVFDLVPDGGTNIFWGCSVKFVARASLGSTSMLVPLDDTGCSYTGDGNLFGSSGVYNPQRFQLTTRSGMVLVLDHSLGLISETDRNGNVLRLDATGIHSSTGESLTFTRDSSSRLTTITGPSGQTLHYTYSSSGDLASSQSPNGAVTTYVYDSNHHLLKTVGPGGPTQTFTYDGSGRLTAITDADGNTAQVDSNVAGQQQTVIDAAGKMTTIDTFDDLGDLVRIDRVAGATTLTATMSYDAAGHLLSVTDPAGGVTSATYDASGNMISVTDALGNTSHYAYDALGNVTSATSPGGVGLVTLGYDASGNPTSITDGGGHTTTLTHDSVGNMTSRTDPSGRTVSYTYTSTGALASSTTAAGTSAYTTDASGHVVSATDPNGHTTSFTYDADGNVLSETDGAGHTRTFTYDSFDRLVTSTDALGGRTSVTYDAAGRPVSITDANGMTVSRTYDADGQLLNASAADGSSAAFAYDGFGHLVSAVTPAATLTFTYDSLGHLASQATGGAQPANTLTSTYDADGRRTSTSGPDGTVRYAYDPLSNLASVTDTAGGVFSYAYDAAQNLVSLDRPDGVVDRSTYDVAGELVAHASANSSSTLASQTYAYSGAGLRTSLVDLGNTATYTFDAASQLLAVASTAPSVPAESYTYDAAGNRITAGATAASYDGAGRLVRYGSAVYAYDAQGQRISMTDAGGHVTSYAWNAFHQLAAVALPGGSVVHFGYDALGRRVEVDQGSSATHYTYDGQNLRLQYSGTTLATSYTYPPVAGTPLEMRQIGTPYYFLSDALGSTVGLADQAGNMVATERYDSFGNPVAATGSVANSLTYIGQQFDSSTGLYFLNARYYDPQTGSFLSPDPLPNPNLYSYSLNDPVDLSDPSGADAAAEYEINLEKDIVAFNDSTAPQTEFQVEQSLTRQVATIIHRPPPLFDAAGDTGQGLGLLFTVLISLITKLPAAGFIGAIGLSIGIAAVFLVIIAVLAYAACSLFDDAASNPGAPAGTQASAARRNRPATPCEGLPQGGG